MWIFFTYCQQITKKASRKRCFCWLLYVFALMFVRLIGLEPTRLTTPDPKSGAATNYATGAYPCFVDCGCKDKAYFRDCKILIQILQHLACRFYHRVFSACDVFAGHIHLDVWVYAEFQLVHSGVEHRAGREANGPAAGDFGRERKT